MKKQPYDWAVLDTGPLRAQVISEGWECKSVEAIIEDADRQLFRLTVSVEEHEFEKLVQITLKYPDGDTLELEPIIVERNS